MDIGTAFKKPFSDITTLIIGIVLTIIPIINILTIPGYFLRIAKKTMEGDNTLPKFSDFGDLVVSSIKLIVVGIVHYVILVIVAAILAFIPYVGGVLSVIWAIVYSFIILSGVMTLAKSGSIGESLNIPELFKKAKRANFIIAVIVGAIIVGIIMSIILGVTVGAALLALLPAMAMGGTVDATALMGLAGSAMIGMIIAMIVGFVLEVFYVTLVAESYK